MNVQPTHNFTGDRAVPPGETLQEWLDERRMTQAELARRTSLTTKHINQVVKGVVGISPEVAISLERVTGVPARFWIQLDANHRTARLGDDELNRLRADTDLLDVFPVAELRRRGHLPKRVSAAETVRAIYQFFGVADRSALARTWIEQPTMLRPSAAFEPDDAALAAWVRLCELDALMASAKAFDESTLREALPDLRSLSQLPGIQWLKPLRQGLAHAGVVLVIEKELPKSRINGAARWVTPDRAMVAVSLRHRRDDIFWFTLFHELGHILLHSKRRTFVDSTTTNIEANIEDEADQFASSTLIPLSMESELLELRNQHDIVAFARRLNVAPGVVVGRLQHEGVLPWNQMNHLLVRYEFIDE